VGVVVFGVVCSGIGVVGGMIGGWGRVGVCFGLGVVWGCWKVVLWCVVVFGCLWVVGCGCCMVLCFCRLVVGFYIIGINVDFKRD
jgi:hypothetical protein